MWTISRLIIVFTCAIIALSPFSTVSGYRINVASTSVNATIGGDVSFLCHYPVALSYKYPYILINGDAYLANYLNGLPQYSFTYQEMLFNGESQYFFTLKYTNVTASDNGTTVQFAFRLDRSGETRSDIIFLLVHENDEPTSALDTPSSTSLKSVNNSVPTASGPTPNHRSPATENKVPVAVSRMDTETRVVTISVTAVAAVFIVFLLFTGITVSMVCIVPRCLKDCKHHPQSTSDSTEAAVTRDITMSDSITMEENPAYMEVAFNIRTSNVTYCNL